MKRHAPATARNRDAILAVLTRVLPPRGQVLEVASGSGEHVVYFAAQLPALTWRPSDPDPAALSSIAAWAAEAGVANVQPPRQLDAAAEAWDVDAADAIVCINMVHIAPWAAALGLFAGAGRLLPEGGVLYLYGPFRFDGGFTAPSNQAFDESLRARDPSWGVRDVEALAAAARARALHLDETVAMPANNHSLVFRKRSEPGAR